LNSRIPLVTASSKLVVHCLPNWPRDHSWANPPTAPSRSSFDPLKGLGQSGPGPLASSLSPTDPTLRANPFPEVRDLFCRLPLPTLFYQPEAAHLGDLLRL
ncbi:predicted protein, partial [Nematostella vectensis]